MSYTIDNKDIVISGWEEGVFDDPYKGIYDMRNCDNVTIPGEVSIAMKTSAIYSPIALSATAYTVDHTTDVFTYSGTPALVINTAIQFTNAGGALPAGLTNTDAYYILTTPTPTTFTISLSAGGAQKLVTDNGSGTNTFSVINMGIPQEIIGNAAFAGSYEDLYFLADSNGRVWGSLTGTSSQWIYMNNLGSELVAKNYNIVCWKGYLFVLGSTGLGYMELGAFSDMSKKADWVLNFQTGLVGGFFNKAIVAQNDVMYFCNGTHISSLVENLGTTFDPTSALTYTYTDVALSILHNDTATCIAELGSDLLIGGVLNLVYPWDRLSKGYSSVIRLSENYTTRMVTINNTTYIFAGNKGRIFITNGGNTMPFWKIPDYLSDTTNPYIRWRDAGFNRNQLYFSFSCTDNAGNTLNKYAGLWAVNVDTSAPTYPRLQNTMSYGTANGYVSAICQYRGNTYTTQPSGDGYGLFVGWYSGTVGGLDKCSSTPYTGGESYIITDPIPVGQFKTKRTFENLEYKLGAPLVSGESVALAYRTDLSASFTDVPITSGGAAGDVSGLTDTINFENAQWVQIKITLTGTATTPSYVRLREVRIR